ncbi:MAG: glycosyltransferase family 39 protein [Anaerolineae bacterium]
MKALLKLPLFRVTGLLLIAWIVFSIGMSTAFFGHHDGSGVWISAAVRNFQLHGAAELGFVPVINRGPATPETYLYYVHHPPVIVWITAGMAALSGLNDMTVRFVAAALSLIAVAGTYAVAKRLFDPRTAEWALIFYLFTPMILYYGRSPNHEPLSLAIIVLYAAVLLSGWRSRFARRWHLLALIGLAVLAGLSSWGAMLGVGLLTAIGFLLGGSRRWRLIAPGIGLIVGIGLFLGLYQHQVPDAIQQITGAFGYRVSAYEYYDTASFFDTRMWIDRQLADLGIFLMPGLIVLGMFGVWGRCASEALSGGRDRRAAADGDRLCAAAAQCRLRTRLLQDFSDAAAGAVRRAAVRAPDQAAAQADWKAGGRVGDRLMGRHVDRDGRAAPDGQGGRRRADGDRSHARHDHHAGYDDAGYHLRHDPADRGRILCISQYRFMGSAP